MSSLAQAIVRWVVQHITRLRFKAGQIRPRNFYALVDTFLDELNSFRWPSTKKIGFDDGRSKLFSTNTSEKLPELMAQYLLYTNFNRK
jgi:hypothetical protein